LVCRLTWAEGTVYRLGPDAPRDRTILRETCQHIVKYNILYRVYAVWITSLRATESVTALANITLVGRLLITLSTNVLNERSRVVNGGCESLNAPLLLLKWQKSS